jgi:hypothetical protein
LCPVRGDTKIKISASEAGHGAVSNHVIAECTSHLSIQSAEFVDVEKTLGYRQRMKRSKD